MRESPKTGRQHKLTADFDHGRRRIKMETDYAIQPGDRVVIGQDPSTGLDRAIKSMMGAFLATATPRFINNKTATRTHVAVLEITGIRDCSARS